ncbi:amidohydrolase family protein [Leifsonia xyli]|uniref:amidohydrolase family protein n=1 Tax=Leifsonia xyli TaxID=1575 RepID=UPI003D675C36
MNVILTNANVRTSVPAHPVADTVVIRDGHIAFVGSGADLRSAQSAEIIDLGGRTVVPGFIDAHTHPSMVAKSSWHVALPWTDDVEELLAFMREYGRNHPREEAPFLYFEYYPGAAFVDAEPTKELLDTAVSDRPVLCQNFSEHEHWVNTAMLELMEVGKDTPDPVPGLELFVRDATGQPTGLIREFAHLHFLDGMFDKLGWRPRRT